MKKVLLGSLALAVAVMFALSVSAGTKVKETKKTGEAKEVETIEASSGGVNITDVTKHRHGDLWKDTVTFKSYKEGDDYVYVTKEDKTYRVKFRDSAKENMMKCKKGDTVTITSTYPLAGSEIEPYIVLHSIERTQKSK